MNDCRYQIVVTFTDRKVPHTKIKFYPSGPDTPINSNVVIAHVYETRKYDYYPQSDLYPLCQVFACFATDNDHVSVAIDGYDKTKLSQLESYISKGITEQKQKRNIQREQTLNIPPSTVAPIAQSRPARPLAQSVTSLNEIVSPVTPPPFAPYWNWQRPVEITQSSPSPTASSNTYTRNNDELDQYVDTVLQHINAYGSAPQFTIRTPSNMRRIQNYIRSVIGIGLDERDMTYIINGVSARVKQ